MTTLTLAPQHTTRYVPAMSDYDTGRQIYRSGKHISLCNTDAQADGWLDAELAASNAYLKEMESAGVPHAVAMAGLDALTAPGWEREYSIESDYEDIRRGN